ncbi:MAG: hypothetical protein KC561_07140 [Myxococcales bacterium]|nr:hypothetical protein [Myxococcales bacterium]
MFKPRSWHSRLIVVAVTALLAGCGPSAGGDGGEASLPIEMSSLSGYWSGVLPFGDQIQASVHHEPVLLHIRPGRSGEEVEWVGETIGIALNARGRVELRDDTLHFYNAFSGNAEVVNTPVVSVSGTTLTLTYSGSEFSLTRQQGCAAPGSYLNAPGRAVDAAIGADGSIHIIRAPNSFLTEDTSTGHAFRTAGDCIFDATGLGGYALDLGPDGALRFVARSGQELQYLEATFEDGSWGTSLTETLPSNFGGVFALTQTADGEPIVIAAKGSETHAIWRVEGTWQEESIPAPGGGLDPLVIDVQHDIEGNVYVRQDRANEVARFDGTAWSAWDLPRPEGFNGVPAFDWDSDGNLIAAFNDVGRSLQGVTVFGRYQDDEWSLYEVGMGSPWSLHAFDDGVVEIATMHDPNNLRILSVISVSGDSPELPTRQRLVQPYTTNQPATFYDSIFKWFPVVAFGPEGTVYVSDDEAGYRARPLEVGTAEATVSTTFDFDTTVPARISIPSLNLECTDDCVLELPWNEIYTIEASAEGASVGVTGGGNPVNVMPLSLGTWSAIAWRPYQDYTLPPAGAVFVTTTEDRVGVALGIPSEGIDDLEGSSHMGLELLSNGSMLVVANSPEGTIEIRDQSGQLTAQFDDCTLTTYNPWVSAYGDNALVSVQVNSGCEEVIGAAGNYLVWLDEELEVLQAFNTMGATLVAGTSSGEGLVFTNQYDSSIGRQWVDLEVIDSEGGSDVVELDLATISGKIWAIEDGFVLLEGTTMTAYDLDGTERWSTTANLSLMGGDVYDGDLILVSTVTASVSVAGHSPAREGEELPSLGTWIVSVDTLTGEVNGDILVPNLPTTSGCAAVPLGGGQFLLVEHPEYQTNFTVVEEGNVVESRFYRVDNDGNCFNGCANRPVFSVLGADGSVWSLTAGEQGTTTFDGTSVSLPTGRALLMRWNR